MEKSKRSQRLVWERKNRVVNYLQTLQEIDRRTWEIINTPLAWELMISIAKMKAAQKRLKIVELVRPKKEEPKVNEVSKPKKYGPNLELF